MSQDRQTAQEMDVQPEKDPLAAAREKKGAPENTAESPPCPRSSPMGISDTLPSTWAGIRGTLGEGTAETSCPEGAGPPGLPPALSEGKGAISSPLSGCTEEHTRHKGFASLVWGATPGMLFRKNRDRSLYPFDLSWVFGYNSSLAVHSLMDGEDRVLLYVSSHIVVVHDILRNRQFHLQGHTNVISCLCVSEDKRWVATADRGPDALIIVWDSYSGKFVFGDGLCPQTKLYAAQS